MTEHQAPAIADLDDPLYYLKNFDTVVAWVADHHGDLLLTTELVRLAELRQLPAGARALLVRLVMRSGELFRRDRLHYPELGQPEHEAAAELIEGGWVTANPDIGFADAARLLTLPELRQQWQDWIREAGLVPSASKRELIAALAPRHETLEPASHWGFSGDRSLLQLNDAALFERVRLMFFGNLYQGWSDFVLVQLGLHRYEAVPLTGSSRAFTERDQIDGYLALQQCREQLDQVSVTEVWPTVPAPFADNPWLETRRARLLFELGLRAEREGERELALRALAASSHPEARLRLLRLLERQGDHRQAWDQAGAAAKAPRNAAEARGLQRLRKRLATKVGADRPTVTPPPPIQEWRLTLTTVAGESVETLTAERLSSDRTPTFYVENTLLLGLFGLLCWDAIFAPLPGAFFHPFHAGPADLNRSDFVSRRQPLFDAGLAGLDDGSYGHRIRQTWREKHGTTNLFVAWPVLTEELLEHALTCIPAGHLRAIFGRLLDDLGEYRSGLPDLVRFDLAQSRYELIEVKGPGDRLQDHQRHWLEFFASQGIPASVCYVDWAETAMD